VLAAGTTCNARTEDPAPSDTGCLSVILSNLDPVFISVLVVAVIEVRSERFESKTLILNIFLLLAVWRNHRLLPGLLHLGPVPHRLSEEASFQKKKKSI